MASPTAALIWRSAATSVSMPWPPLILRARKPCASTISAASRAIASGGCRVTHQLTSTFACPPSSCHRGLPAAAARSVQHALSISILARKLSGKRASWRLTAAASPASISCTAGSSRSSSTAASDRGETPDQVGRSGASATPTAPSSPTTLRRASTAPSSMELNHLHRPRVGQPAEVQRPFRDAHEPSPPGSDESRAACSILAALRRAPPASAKVDASAAWRPSPA